MREDEEGTVRTLTAYREVLANFIRKHGGRVVDSPGDNVLAEFASVVDAVQSAVEIQKELKARNADLPDNRKMEFRIGINLGDIIKKGKRIYGDGVNIAARVEGLAEGGGVSISGTVYEHVKDKLALGYESLGEHTVKNIPEPVRVYRVLPEPEAARKATGEKKPGLRRWQWVALSAAAAVVVAAAVIWYFAFRPSYPRVEPASADRMAHPLPDKPSIAVLPFTNMTGDPEQEYFCDGLTEEIITALCKVEDMFVIARNSTFTYKGKAVKVKQVAEEMGVRYVLEGSVRKAEDRVRITGQLIDALTGHHMWAERYDRDLRDIFALHDEITMRILTALQVKLTEGEDARLRARGTDSLEAWGNFVRGVSFFLHFAPEGNSKARELFEEAIRLDPEYATAWTWLSWTYYMDARMGFRETPAESLKRAVEIAQKALALDDTLPEVHSLWNTIYLFQRQHDKAIAEGKKAIALGPNASKSYALLAETMYHAGGFEEAIALLEKAMRLSPHYPKWYLNTLAKSYTMVGRYEEAIAANNELLERSQKGEPFAMWAHLGLAMTYMMLGRQGEARSHAAEVLKIDPNWSLEQERKASFYKDPDDMERHLDALRKAGIPEKPPLALSEKPSIAVLPFTNMSGDPEQEYFSDGLTEEIITALSKVHKMVVIARNSTFKL
jgi:adenylate cyclase